MKNLLLTLTAGTILASSSFAGNFFGGAPFANGGYWPGQFDGRYTATIYNNLNSTNIPSPLTTNTNSPSSYVPSGVVSGVLGFGIRNGAPSTSQTTTNAAASSSANSFASSFVSDSIRLDTSHNYFVAFIDGQTFAGQTIANVNIDQNSVSGNLLNGMSSAGFERVETPVLNTNGTRIGTTVSFVSVPGGIAGGFFNASITKNQAVFAFSGPGKITTQKVVAASTNTPTAPTTMFTYPFNLNGVKTSYNTASGYVQQTTGN